MPEKTNPSVLREPPRRSDLTELLRHARLQPHFQAIVDLLSQDVLGYEVLTRAPSPFLDTENMFAQAEAWGMAWELDEACLRRAWEQIDRVPSHYQSRKFFLNVTPAVFSDERFSPRRLSTFLTGAGVGERQIVLEITEIGKIGDYGSIERRVRMHSEAGYQIALDDFGSGHSSLLTLVAISPHYLKLDQAIVSGVTGDSYKQHLVKSIVTFASNVESKLIAEGVERLEDLETLMRLGVRYAQGYLFHRPSPQPGEIDPNLFVDLRRLSRRYLYPRASFMAPISSMVLRPKTFEVREARGGELDEYFRQRPLADHVVILRDGRPDGVITKQHFYTLAAGPYGYTLVQKKRLEDIAKRHSLAVNEGLEVTALGRLAMERDPEDIYDPVIVTNERDEFIGTITMKQLLNTSMRIELQLAQSANPLTGLPGNAMIERWLQDALQTEEYSIAYADLDNFKEFNDSFGFPLGDQIIKLAARVLAAAASRVGAEIHLGHVGGDDFVLIAKAILTADLLQGICSEFDREKAQFFPAEALERHAYRATDRQGNVVEIPLVTLSLAVITSHNGIDAAHSAAFGSMSASLKKKVKSLNSETGQSGFLFERRRYDEIGLGGPLSPTPARVQ